VTFTTQQDHQNMLEQLGITRLRPGRNANATAANAANYDEAQANPYPDLPDPLALKSGERVTTPEMWWKVRQPQIVEDFEHSAQCSQGDMDHRRNAGNHVGRQTGDREAASGPCR
jgi:hypothetical protein